MTDDPKQLADEDGWRMTTEPVGEGLCLKPAHARLEAERDAALASLENAEKERDEWKERANAYVHATADLMAERDRYRGVAEALADQNPVEGWPFGHRVNLVSLATAALSPARSSTAEEKP